jgi:hypothetical protein
MAGSTLNSFFNDSGASNPYSYKPDSSVFGGSTYDYSKPVSSNFEGGYEEPEWLKGKNPYAYEPGSGESKGKSFLDKFTNALYEGAGNARKFNQQQEKDKERSIATPSSMGGGSVQQLTDNFTALYPQTFSPFTVAGVQGEPGIGGKILSAATPLLGLIPGVGPALAAGANIGASFLG